MNTQRKSSKLENLIKKALNLVDNKVYGSTERDKNPKTPFYNFEEVERSKKTKSFYGGLVWPSLLAAGTSACCGVNRTIDFFQSGREAFTNYIMGTIPRANSLMLDSGIDLLKSGTYIALTLISSKVLVEAMERYDVLNKKIEEYDLDQETVEQLNILGNLK